MHKLCFVWYIVVWVHFTSIKSFEINIMFDCLKFCAQLFGLPCLIMYGILADILALLCSADIND